MPKVTLGRNVSPELNDEAWIAEFSEAVESRRRKSKPTYTDIASAVGITREALRKKFLNGHFSLEEFSGIAKYMKFTDVEILHLVKSRVTR